MKTISFLFVIFLSINLNGQILNGIATKWSDTFSEWVLFVDIDGEEVEGELRMRWPSRNDWTEWNYRLEEETGTIKLKWRDNPNEWELRGDNEVVTARTVYNNSFREWR